MPEVRGAAAGAPERLRYSAISTPSKLRMHSWHPVPVMIVSEWTRPDPQAAFGERACARGELGVFPAKDLMTLMLAHAGRLVKFGA